MHVNTAYSRPQTPPSFSMVHAEMPGFFLHVTFKNWEEPGDKGKHSACSGAAFRAN